MLKGDRIVLLEESGMNEDNVLVGTRSLRKNSTSAWVAHFTLVFEGNLIFTSEEKTLSYRVK